MIRISEIILVIWSRCSEKKGLLRPRCEYTLKTSTVVGAVDFSLFFSVRATVLGGTLGNGKHITVGHEEVT